MSKQRSLMTEEKAKVITMSAEGLSPHAIGQEIGRDPKTIRAYVNAPETRKEIAVIQEKLAAQFEDVATRLLASIKDADIDKAPADKRVIAACAATDKSRTIRGLSNANIAVAGVQIITSCSELRSLLEENT